MRRALFLLIVLAGLVVTTGVASAHVEVEAEPSQASAENATLNVSAEAESDTAGIVRLEIAPPSDFDVTGVTLATAPDGWTLAPTDLGFAISGPALPAGEDLKAAVKVPKLPASTETQLKALVTYSDGKIDRWIEERQAGQPEPEHPTALLTLEPAAGGSTTTVAEQTTTTGAEQTTTTAADSTSDSDDSSSAWPIVIAVVVVAALVGVGILLLRRRGSGGSPSA